MDERVGYQLTEGDQGVGVLVAHAAVGHRHDGGVEGPPRPVHSPVEHVRYRTVDGRRVAGPDCGVGSGRRFGGQWFGGRKLAPRISPNKTLEGVAGGVGLAMVVGVIGALLIGARLGQLPAVALVAAFTVLFSVAGDLFESLLKRHVGAKDSGTLIPGHGGVLDRIDSVLAALCERRGWQVVAPAKT